jgi:hypothetical protein
LQQVPPRYDLLALFACILGKQRQRRAKNTRFRVIRAGGAVDSANPDAKITGIGEGASDDDIL